MPIRTLDHVNVRTAALAETCAFFGDVLGMDVTPSPGQPDMAHNAWVRDDDGRAVIHLMDLSMDIDAIDGGVRGDPQSGTGAVHHVAFTCDGYDAMLERLTEAGAAVRQNDVPEFGLRQLFVSDPNGVLVELNFR